MVNIMELLLTTMVLVGIKDGPFRDEATVTVEPGRNPEPKRVIS